MTAEAPQPGPGLHPHNPQLLPCSCFCASGFPWATPKEIFITTQINLLKKFVFLLVNGMSKKKRRPHLVHHCTPSAEPPLTAL